MPRLVIVNHYAGRPGATTTGVRHHNLARQLVDLGWQVTIVAASTTHPAGAQGLTTGRKPWRRERIDAVDYCWIWAPTYRAGNGLSRVLNMLWFAFVAALFPRLYQRGKIDVVIGSTVHPFAAFAGYRVSRSANAPFIFEIRDLWPETIIQMGGVSRRHPAMRFLAVTERFLCTRAVAIVTTMPHGADYLERIGIPRDKVTWISNGVEPTRFDPTPRPPHDEFVFTYFGSFGQANGLHYIIEGFAESAGRSPRSLRLRLVGGGAELESLRARVRQLHIADRVSFAGAVPSDEIPAIAHDSDALVACLLPLPLYEFGISLNKLFEYLAAGRPILFAGSAKGNPLDDTHGAQVVGVSGTEIAEAMLHIASLTDIEREMAGDANRALAEGEFSFRVLAGRLNELLESAVNTVTPSPRRKLPRFSSR
jgi:glycosyltransferase involved in cell wall biosynthesis